MVKKYSMIFIVLGMFLFFCIVATKIFAGRGSQNILPVLSYKNESGADIFLNCALGKIFPLLLTSEEKQVVAKREDFFKLKSIKPVELLTMMEAENMQESMETISMPEGEVSKVEMPEEIMEITERELPEETQIMAQISDTIVNTDFQKHSLQQIIDINTLADYESLVKNFYTIDACAMVGSEYLDAENLSKIDLRITKQTEGPQILIYHTHSQEGFIDSVPGEEATTIVGVGEHLANILEEEYGYTVLHHKGKYDVESRDNAYSRSLPEIVKILEENPSIEVIIDLHRDAVADDYKLVMELDGRQTARFMFFNGVSCTKNTGKIGYLENENQLDNLAFSFQMKKAAEEYYPGLTRKNYIHGYRYNMHLLPRTTLIELGAQNNTVEEAMNACDPIAHILDMVLNGA